MTDELGNQDKDLPGPTEGPDTSTTGSTDKRSSENRREGLRKDSDTSPNNERENEDTAQHES